MLFCIYPACRLLADTICVDVTIGLKPFPRSSGACPPSWHLESSRRKVHALLFTGNLVSGLQVGVALCKCDAKFRVKSLMQRHTQ